MTADGGWAEGVAMYGAGTAAGVNVGVAKGAEGANGCLGEMIGASLKPPRGARTCSSEGAWIREGEEMAGGGMRAVGEVGPGIDGTRG